MYSYDGYLLFQSQDVKVPITLLDVRDALDCCSGILNEQMKSACYLQFGVDGKMAEKYYRKLEKMEKLYMVLDDPEKHSKPADNVAPPKMKQEKKSKKGMFGKWFIFKKMMNDDNDEEK